MGDLLGSDVTPEVEVFSQAEAWFTANTESQLSYVILILPKFWD